MSTHRCIGIFTAGLDDEYQANLCHAMEQEASRRSLGTISFIGSRLGSPIASEASSNLAYHLASQHNIDGSGEFRTFNQIILPIMKPAIATQAIFTFVASWNNLFIPLILLTRQEKYTMPIMVSLLRGDIYKTEYGSVYLGLTLTVLPLFVMYFILSKYIIAGVALGALKE